MLDRGRQTEFTGFFATLEQRSAVERMAGVEGRTVSGMMRWLVDEERRRRGWMPKEEETREASDGTGA